ncbi:MAG: EAL domain-containing protein [Alphaproteobacteria bacterium]|nr:EAL domain-containing protein [Alphaproteobacteria bacterium]
MKLGRSTGWMTLSIAIAVLGVGAGWGAAWQVDRNAMQHWRVLAEEEAADVTESVAVMLEQAESQLLAFARSLPDGLDDGASRFDAIFTTEASALNLLEGRTAFQGLAYATRIPAAGRADFEDTVGIEILGPEGKPAKREGEGFVTLRRHGPTDHLFVGLDLAADPRLGPTASDGFRVGGIPVTGPSFLSEGHRLSPVAIRQGNTGVVIGLLDLTELLDTSLTVSLPEGLTVRIEERRPGEATPPAAIFEVPRPATETARLEWETRYAQGGVGWRFVWSADDRFRGGIPTELGNGLRIGSILLSVLVMAVLGFGDAARRRSDALSRERALMQATVERMSEGINVVDRDLNIVAANEHFFRLYDLPTSLRKTGFNVETVVRLRLERGEYGPIEDWEAFVAKRLDDFRRAETEIIEETLGNGNIIEIRRTRTPDGLLISLYLDVTERRRSEAERAAAAALISTTFEHMSDGLTAVDAEGRVLNWNRRFLDLFGMTDSDVDAGRNLRAVLRDAIAPEDAAAVEQAFDRTDWDAPAPTGPDGQPAIELVQLSGDRWLQLSHRAIPGQGYVITYTDVTERTRVAEALRQSEERYALAAAGANDGLWDWDIAADRLYTSPRWREMLGLGRDPLSERPDEWLDRVHPSDIEELEVAIQEHLGGRTEHLQKEFRILHADGAYLWTLARAIAVRDDEGQAVRLTGSLTDITERKRAEEKLIRDALYDTVTGLPNRALFLDRIAQEKRRHPDPSGDPFAVLLFDLDRFKVVNDSLGHDLGDALLIEVARRLESTIRPGDSVARLSGDEFGVLMTGVSGREAIQDAVHWLQSDIAAAFVIGDQEIFTSACVGIALPSLGFADAEEMLRAADIAMYKAKDLGQSSTAVFDPQMQSRAITQMQLENDLRRAVDRDEIEMYYQPIISFRDGRIAGVEALARWRHPDRGTVVPADFIPLAEDTGMITSIGTAALRLACRQMKEWERDLGDRAPETMSVNLSSRQLQDPDMVREIELILAREGVPGSRLKLEVTESMIMMNPEITSRILFELKELGVALSIDDFGTGYSSLSYLHRFPFDTLKIDRSFVVSMEEKSENMEIIRSIALLAHNLGMDIIAEGVESDRHLLRLHELDCEFGQGYYFASPQPADRIAEMIRQGRVWQEVTSLH